MTNKPFVTEMHVIRAAAVLGVLIVHSTSNALIDVSSDSRFYSIFVILNTIFKYGTPMFLFLSAFVLFYNYWDRKIDKSFLVHFYKRRLLYIIVPYLSMSLFYFISKAYLFYGFPDGEAIKKFFIQLATGRVHFHLYFIFVLVQFYVLFPVLLFLLKRFSFLVKHLLWMGIVLQWMFVLINHYYLHIPYKGSVWLSYISFSFAGIYTAIYYDKIKSFLKITKTACKHPKAMFGYAAFYLGALFCMTGNTYIWISLRKYGITYDSKVYEFFWHFQHLWCIFLFLQFFITVFPLLSKKIQSMFFLIADTSFGIYLLHPFFLMLYELLPLSGNVYLYVLQTIGKLFFISVMPVLVIFLLQRLSRYHWLMIGNNTLIKR